MHHATAKRVLFASCCRIATRWRLPAVLHQASIHAPAAGPPHQIAAGACRHAASPLHGMAACCIACALRGDPLLPAAAWPAVLQQAGHRCAARTPVPSLVRPPLTGGAGGRGTAPPAHRWTCPAAAPGPRRCSSRGGGAGARSRPAQGAAGCWAGGRGAPGGCHPPRARCPAAWGPRAPAMRPPGCHHAHRPRRRPGRAPSSIRRRAGAPVRVLAERALLAIGVSHVCCCAPPTAPAANFGLCLEAERGPGRRWWPQEPRCRACCPHVPGLGRLQRVALGFWRLNCDSARH